jgi:hypothetical protein
MARRFQSVAPRWRRRHPCADRSRAGASTGAPQVNALQIGLFEVVSKAVNRHRRFEGSNPSPSASAQNPFIQGRFLGCLGSITTRSGCQSCQL